MSTKGSIKLEEVKDKPVTFWTLPHKSQLAILCLARIADPLAATSVNSYIYFYVSHLKPEASAAEIAAYIGLLVGVKTGAKVFTGLLWGRLSDSSIGGRKMVLLIGILSGVLSTLGFGFSNSFASALFWQSFGTAMNSNVGMIRCMVADLNPEKRTRSRALLLLPLISGIGMFLGPLLGGFLSTQTATTGLLSAYPYALPNIVIASCYGISGLGVLFFLQETLETHNANSRPFLALWNKLRGLVLRTENRDAYSYSAVGSEAPVMLEESPATSPTPSRPSTSFGTPEIPQQQAPPSNPAVFESAPRSLSFREIWTPQVIATLFAQFIINGHMGTFTTLWVVFLATPIAKMPPNASSPWAFSGGLSLTPASIGTLMSILAGLGVILQLFVYPRLSDRFSTVRIWRTSLFVFPLGYLAAPFPALVAAHFYKSITRVGDEEKLQLYQLPVPVIATLAGIFVLLMLGRMGVNTSTTLLINDCVPAPSARGTINMAGTVTSSLSKCVFPPVLMIVYGWGLKRGVVGTGFWALSGLAVAAVLASFWVRDGESQKEKEKDRVVLA